MAREDGRSGPGLTDEDLDYYGDLYVEHRLADVVIFENFLQDPEQYLLRYARSLSAASYRPRAGWWRTLLAALGLRPLARSPHA
jgi:hypothetical protein